MKKALVAVGLLASAVVVATAGPSEAWHHGPRVFVGVGPYPYWGYPYYGYRYAYPYAYAPPPVVVQQEPPVYIEQPPAAGADAPAEPGYWYFCPTSRQYYPSAPNCSEPWVRVPARSQ